MAHLLSAINCFASSKRVTFILDASCMTLHRYEIIESKSITDYRYYRLQFSQQHHQRFTSKFYYIYNILYI